MNSLSGKWNFNVKPSGGVGVVCVRACVTTAVRDCDIVSLKSLTL